MGKKCSTAPLSASAGTVVTARTALGNQVRFQRRYKREQTAWAMKVGTDLSAVTFTTDAPTAKMFAVIGQDPVLILTDS